jgi:glycosyltransferase involved in cell wall biosynthesis
LGSMIGTKLLKILKLLLLLNKCMKKNCVNLVNKHDWDKALYEPWENIFKMKILIVAPYFYPKIGGMENYAYNISKELKEKYGWEVVVVTSNHKERKYIKEEIEGMKIYRLPIWLKVSNTPINLLWYFQIKKIIKKEKPDVINAQTPVPFMAECAALVAGKIPFILTIHAASLYKYNNLVANIILLLYSAVQKISLKRADAIVAVSAYVKKSLSFSYQKKTYVINNAISKKEILENTVRKNTRQVIFIGSLNKTHAWKGLSYIIESIKHYTDLYGKDINLEIIGDGDYDDYYKQLVSKLHLAEYIHFVGRKNKEEKDRFLEKSSAIMVYPYTENDALPTVILEAWAKQVPVIASSIGPIPYLITHKHNGFLIRPKSAKLLSEGLHELLHSQSLQDTIINNAVVTLKNHFLLEDTIRALNELFLSIAKQRQIKKDR